MMSPFDYAMPEIFLLAAACVVLLLDIFLTRDLREVTYLAAQASLLATAGVVYTHAFTGDERLVGLGRHYVIDELGGVLKISILLLTMVVFVYARKFLRDQAMWRGEFFVLSLTAVLGMMIMVSGYNLLVLYLGLELLALSMYALVAMRRDDSRANEAAMKYFVLGAIASGLLLYGLSMLYGLTGELSIRQIHEFLLGVPGITGNLPLLFTLVFLVAAVAFKFGAMPFHMWLPDVYHGAPTIVTLFLGSVPKIAAFALLMRLLAEGLASLSFGWSQLFLVLGLLSVAGGNLVAIAQTSFKRMLAYSTIAHMGFILMGAMTATHGGYSAAMFYVLVYALMAAGAFGVLVVMGREGFEADSLDDLKGLNERNPWLAFIMLLLLFSMAGIPPTVGFYAKLAVIKAVVDADLVWAAVIMVVMSVAGAYYYLRAIKMMYFDKPEPDSAGSVGADVGLDCRIVMGLNGVLMLILGIFPGVLMGVCSMALQASSL
ncbi:MAG TPA: NADH-quinone oxidoreductase subunit NuoN [Thiolinea sp.]|nr:NADH-quinone oxidoreductase subunit NuoN [Thiolinea sp.]